MMTRYPEDPDWWFGIFFLLSFYDVIAPTALVMFVPGCLIYAVTGYQLGFSTLAVIIIGYIIPGNGWNIDDQAESYISDQKMSYYVKLPPRAMFGAQMLATLIQTLITVGVVEFSISSIKDSYSYTQVDRFICTFPHSLYADMIMFGILGPARMFNSLYLALKCCFLVGFLIVMKSHDGARHIIWRTTPPGLCAGLIFNYYIKRHYIGWWTKYNYVLSTRSFH
ncbi:OPT oligopeptide transporter protein-domain-containing protein [Lipomyces doorenjongii]|uniref:OPT oligopeptide transporter protein-domain-containing protein n=1 Tax=Lipomyces doorenjongii TaxID=383834 RepID=UPI0034CD3FC9